MVVDVGLVNPQKIHRDATVVIRPLAKFLKLINQNGRQNKKETIDRSLCEHSHAII